MLEQNLHLDGKTVLVTGAAGFIGANLTMALLRNFPDVCVVGLDNMNDYYDVSIKEYRTAQIEKLAEGSLSRRWVFVRGSITDRALVDNLFATYRFSLVINLAAQAGVRYSITNPDVYVESNIIGFYNILEACRSHPVEHLVFASSSSVYGTNTKIPYATEDKVDTPVSLYAATKKSNELMAHAYAKLYNIPTTGLRFFTVYGPAGRPDMAYFSFTDKLRAGKTIEIFNYGNCKRDFTYIDDIVQGILRVLCRAPERHDGQDGLPMPPYRIYNIGNSAPESLTDFIKILHEELLRVGLLPENHDLASCIQFVPMQPGDVPITYADTSALERDCGFKPATPLRHGLARFAEWYRAFYRDQAKH